MKVLMDLPDLAEAALSYGSKEYDLYSSMGTKPKHSRCVSTVYAGVCTK